MTLINVCSASGRASPTFLVSWIMRSPSPRKKNLVNKKLLFQYLISWRMKKKISMALSNIKLFLEMIVIFLKKKIEMLGLRPSKNWEKKSLNIIKFLWGHSIFMFFFFFPYMFVIDTTRPIYLLNLLSPLWVKRIVF